MEDYVTRKFANSFLDTVETALQHTQSELFKICQTATSNEILDASRKIKDKSEEQIKKGIKVAKREIPIVFSDDENEVAGDIKKTTGRGAAKSSIEDLDDVETGSLSNEITKGRSRKAVSKVKSKPESVPKPRGRKPAAKPTYAEDDYATNRKSSRSASSKVSLLLAIDSNFELLV